MAPDSPRQTDRWKSDDAAEEYVRHLLVRFSDAFQNNWISEKLEQGEFLPRMSETIPGQYDATHGIDIIAVDGANQLWIIEVSRGTYRGGAIPEKGEGKPVAYADGTLQMSATWRKQAALRFLDRMADATEMLRDLLHIAPTENDEMVKLRFLHRLQRHRKAVIIPEGAHFYTTGTDIDWLHEVYTCRFPAALQARQRRHT